MFSYALSQGQRIDALTARAKVNAACRSFNHQIESLDIEMIKDVQTLRYATFLTCFFVTSYDVLI